MVANIGKAIIESETLSNSEWVNDRRYLDLKLE